MTKIGVDETAKVAPESQPPEPQYVVSMPAKSNAQTNQMLSSARCWYVTSIISAIFCCPLFGMFGLVHSMFADHEAAQGNVMKHRRRLCQARCWTISAIILGVVIISLFAAGAYMQFRHQKRMAKANNDVHEWFRGLSRESWMKGDDEAKTPKPDFDKGDEMRPTRSQGHPWGGEHGQHGGYGRRDD